MALTAQITLSLLAHETAAGDLSRSLRATPAGYATTLTDGTAAGQAQVAWSDARTLAGSSESLSLAALSDTRDGATATVEITAVKAMYIKNTHASVSLTFSGGPLTASGVVLGPGAVFVIADASAAGIAAGTLAVAGSAGGTYEIVIIGEGSVS